MNERIAKLIRFLKEHIPKGFAAYCIYSEPTSLIYDEDGLRVYLNEYYAHIEILGLTHAEKKMIEKSGWLDCCWKCIDCCWE